MGERVRTWEVHQKRRGRKTTHAAKRRERGRTPTCFQSVGQKSLWATKVKSRKGTIGGKWIGTIRAGHDRVSQQFAVHRQEGLGKAQEGQAISKVDERWLLRGARPTWREYHLSRQGFQKALRWPIWANKYERLRFCLLGWTTFERNWPLCQQGDHWASILQKIAKLNIKCRQILEGRMGKRCWVLPWRQHLEATLQTFWKRSVQSVRSWRASILLLRRA